MIGLNGFLSLEDGCQSSKCLKTVTFGTVFYFYVLASETLIPSVT